MLDPYPITPVTQPLRGTVRPPGSKSLTNRALVVSALADGASRLSNVLESQDTRVMIESLQRLGIQVDHDPEGARAVVPGCGGRIPASQADLWLENSGTSIRFLTALCALGRGRYRLDGNERMRERPIGDLVDALTQLGVNAGCELGTQAPPVTVQSQGLRGGTARIAGSISSQFLSGLLMAAPRADGPIELHVEGELVSEPYIDMTLGVMARFGVLVETSEKGRFFIEPQPYRATEYDIEPDASAASYFFAAAAITGGEITVQGLAHDALQGDVAFVEVLRQMGCRVTYRDNSINVAGGKELRGIEIDMNAVSDTAQTLAAVAIFAEGPTRIYNVAHMRHKETDRIAAMATELRRLGLQVDEQSDGLTIHPAPPRPAVIETYDDHRMAMSFALVGLRAPGIRIANPRCTEKTYPRFFDDLEALRRQ